MAQELEIVKILREMKRANSTNSESFDRLLTSIGNKLETMDKNSESTELIKAYFVELAKTIDDKYATTISNFSDIEQALVALFKEQEGHVKTKDIKNLSDMFTQNMENFYSETAKQKEILAGIEKRIKKINSKKSDKESITNAINLLRNDFETLNHDYKLTVDSINSDVKTILTSLLKADKAVSNDEIKVHTEAMGKAANEITAFLNYIDKREANLEMLLSQVATSENLKITQSVVDSIIKKSEGIYEQLNSLSSKDDIEELQSATDVINKKLNESVTKKLFTKISNKTEALISHTEEIKQTLADVTKNIEALPDISILEKSLQKLFSKLESLNEDITKADTKENVLEIDTKLGNLISELSTIKNIVSDLNDVVTTKVLSAINDISFEQESFEIKSHVSKMLAKLPLKEDVELILQNNEFSKKSFEELTNKTNSLEARIDKLPTSDDINTLSSKTDEIEEMIDNLNFDNEFENIYNKAATIEKWLEDSNVKENTEKISIQLQSKAEQEDTIAIRENVEKITNRIEEFSKNTDSIEEKLTSISEYIESADKTNTEDLKIAVAEIREFLQNKNSNLNDIEKTNSQIAEMVEQYLKEIKVVLDTSDNKIDKNTSDQIVQLEQSLNSYKESNENALTEIIAKLDDFQSILNEKDEIDPKSEVFEASINEISELKNKINTLCESFNSLKNNEKTEDNSVSEFVSSNLSEIAQGLDNLSSDIEAKLEHGFTYNAELLEEKTSVLLDFIKELRHASTENIELYERLTVTDNRLMDFKQELELINTDVINNLNSKTDRLLEELEPIKQMLSSISTMKIGEEGQNVKENLDVLHDSVQGDLAECTKYSKSTFNKLEDTYEQISKDLSATENNLRDFILGDIDSVIIKLDSLREVLDESLDRISPPEAEHMKEFKDFVNQINSFKDDQKKVITDAADDVKETITDQLTQQHKELKSMLTVAINNKEIVRAIEDLKKCFKSKTLELSELQAEEDIDQNSDDISSETFEEDFGANQYEKAFEIDKNAQIIEEIREDFNKFSELIKDLSDDNSEIEEVLNVIKSKMDSISVVKQESDFLEIIEDSDEAEFDDADNEDSEDLQTETESEPVIDEASFEDEEETTADESQDSEEPEKVLVGSGNFDFIKALNFLKQDILKLQKDVDKVISKEDQKKVSTSLSSIPTLGNDNLLMSLNNKIEQLTKVINPKEWLGEIKTYIADDEIHTMLEEISGKIDILTLSDNSEWIAEIKQALDQLNSSDAAGSSDPHIQSMLALINEKIDILAASDDYDMIEEVRDAIEEMDQRQNSETQKALNIINEKIDIIAASDNTDNFEDIKDILGSIESKISSAPAHSSEQSNNLDDIKDILDSIEYKIDSAADSETSNNIEDIKYTLLNVDEKVDSVKKLSEADAKITSMLEDLNHKIDNISNDGDNSTKKGFEDIKALIMAQMDYIDSLDKNNKTDAVKKCLKELTAEVNNLNSNENTKKIQSTIRDMKESIMAAVVTIFEQVSFVEESEDIKDFVEEKTDEINQNLAAVTSQLKQITSTEDGPDYTYSMQDIESDLAKLRLALNDLQTNEQENNTVKLTSILENINQIGTTVYDLQNSLTKEEVFGLRIKFDRINTDIKSLNALTNQLIQKSKESCIAFEDFGKVITNQLTKKVDNVTKLLETSNASDKVMRQALIYMGEWIDSTSESMNKISTNSDEIIDIKSAIEGIKKTVPEQTDILNSIEEKFDEQQERLAYFEKQISKLGGLEDRFEEQQERIDRLEVALEKILSAVEDIDDSKVTRKIDKIDKQIAKLSTNIEKLTSYVD